MQQPKFAVGETKVSEKITATTAAAQSIIDAEKRSRDEKSARLRAAREAAQRVAT